MSALIAAWMPLNKLEEIVDILKEKDAKGFNMTIGVNDESNEWNQNVAIWAEQTKEQKADKVERYFCGNGRVIWNNGKIENATKKDSSGGFTTPSNEELEGKAKSAEEKPKAATKKEEKDLPF